MSQIISTHSRNYLGYLTSEKIEQILTSTHSRNYLGYLTLTKTHYRIIIYTQ